MQLLGKSLEDILNLTHSKTFSIKATCNLAYQMINLLEYIHNKHIIHRDIKPDNFVMGRGNEKTMVYLIDFGLAKKFRSSKTLKHCPMTNKKKLTGTARYASVNALKGIEQSRRDDLESLGYVLLYFLKGNLPWQGLPIKNKEDRYTKIMEKKRDTSPAELCAGFPKQFEEYVKYTQGLEYEEDPKYDYLKGLFESTVQALGYNGIDRVFDWMVKISDSEKSKEKKEEKPQITVVNNYYHNVNNIVINPNDNEIGNDKKNHLITNTIRESKGALRYSNIKVDELFNSNINGEQQIHQESKIYQSRSLPNDTHTIEIGRDISKSSCCCYIM